VFFSGRVSVTKQYNFAAVLLLTHHSGC